MQASARSPKADGAQITLSFSADASGIEAAVHAASRSIDAHATNIHAEKQLQADADASARDQARAAMKKELRETRPPSEKEWLHEGLDKVLDPAKRDAAMEVRDRREKKSRLDHEGKVATMPATPGQDDEARKTLQNIDKMRADFKAADQNVIQPSERAKQRQREERYRNTKHPGFSAHHNDGAGLRDVPLVESNYDDGSSGESRAAATAALMKDVGAIMRPDGSYVTMGVMGSLTAPHPASMAHQAADGSPPKALSFSLSTYYQDPYSYVAAALRAGVPVDRVVLPKDCGVTLDQVLHSIGRGPAAGRTSPHRNRSSTRAGPSSPTMVDGGFGSQPLSSRRNPSSFRMAPPLSSPSVASFRRRAATSSPVKQHPASFSRASTYNQGLLRETISFMSRREASMEDPHLPIWHATKTSLARDTGRLHTSAWDERLLKDGTMHTRSPKTLVMAGAEAAGEGGFFFGADSSIGPQEDKRVIKAADRDVQAFRERAMRETEQGRRRVLAPEAQSLSPPDRAKLAAEERAAYLKLGSADGTGVSGVFGRRTISPERLAETIKGGAGMPSPIAMAGAAAMGATMNSSFSFGANTAPIPASGPTAGAAGSSPTQLQERLGKRLVKPAVEVSREQRGIGGLDLTGKGGPSNDAPRRGRKMVEGGISAHDSHGVAGALKGPY